MDELYKKFVKCNNITCYKEQKKLYNTVIQKGKSKLNKKQKQIVSVEDIEERGDEQLIERGD